MPLHTPLTERLGIGYPVFCAPMAGGPSTPALAAAVSEAGGLGFLAAAYQTPQRVKEAAREVRALTGRPFGINLFAPLPKPEERDAAPMLARLARYHAELGIEPPTAPAPVPDPFEGLFEAALESGAAALSFTFGLLPPDAVPAAKARGMLVIGTATTVAEAVALEQSGVDAVVAQGAEAGAHRGTFSGDFEAAMVGTVALVPLVADAVRVAVIASGGIMDGRGIVAALALGASAVQMGTAFLACGESGASEAYKQAVLSAREDQTRVTRAFSGRPARGVVNRFMEEVEAPGTAGEILDYPLQNALTRPMRAAAGKAGRAELLSLWAGQGAPLARRLPAAELVRRLVAEADATLGRLGA